MYIGRKVWLFCELYIGRNSDILNLSNEGGTQYEENHKDKKGGGNNGEQTSQAGVHTFKGI